MKILYGCARWTERKLGIKFVRTSEPYASWSLPCSLSIKSLWVVVGLLGGGIAGALMTWERGGFGLWKNLALGLTGAIIGGLLFRIFGIWPGLDKIAISLRDIVSAVVGSLLVLGALWLWRRFVASQENT